MPIIRFRRSAPNQSGDAPATGYYRFALNKPLTIPGDPDETVTTAPFKVGLVAGGVDAELAPTPTGYAWQVLESIDGIPDVTYWVTVPDVPGPLDDGDLTRVNPSTLSPRATPEAAWWAAVAGITPPAGAMYVLTDTDGRPYFG